MWPQDLPVGPVHDYRIGVRNWNSLRAGREAGVRTVGAQGGNSENYCPSPGFRAEGSGIGGRLKILEIPPRRRSGIRKGTRFSLSGLGGRILGISSGGQQSRSAFAPVGSSRGQRFSEFRGESASSRFSVQQPCRQAVVSVLKFGGPSFSDYLPPPPLQELCRSVSEEEPQRKGWKSPRSTLVAKSRSSRRSPPDLGGRDSRNFQATAVSVHHRPHAVGAHTVTAAAGLHH